MNLALRGISHNLGEEAENTFRLDLHKEFHLTTLWQIRRSILKTGLMQIQ